MKKLVIILLAASLALLVYSYLCRVLSLYFFWESKYIGWFLLFITLLIFLSWRIKIRRRLKKKTILETIAICLISFVLVVQIIFFIVLANSDAYQAAKKYIASNEETKKQIGDIEGFSLIPAGTMSVSSSEAGERGKAEIDLIVKGRQKFAELTVDLRKELSTAWQVVAIY